MAEFLGGAFLSATLQVLFDRIASRQVVDFFKSRKLNYRQLKKLETLMITVNKLLNDAEEKQITDSLVKKWLNELKDAVYEAEDFLDEIAYENLRQEVEHGYQTISIQVLECLSWQNQLGRGKGKMEAKLEEVLERIHDLVQQKDALGLRECFGERPSLYKIPTTSLVEDSGVYGRDGDKEDVMKFLLSDGANGKLLDVVPIVGMGGVGKTTLAQLIYNDSRVQQQFDLKAWICVSEEFNVLKLIKDILKEVGSTNCDAMTENQLHQKLQKKVTKKRVLLVLDDVWSDDEAKWDFLLTPFNSVARGSKIVLTTRNESVASVKATVAAHCLRGLTSKDCWLVFTKHAFEEGSYSACPDLKEIGREIVIKCDGLPLAAKALGGLLRSNRDAKEWKKVLKSDMWNLPKDPILPALRLSYSYLPSPLKQCFAYCAIFPKDYQFDKDELVHLWMAEGFLTPTKGNEAIEDIGDECFHDLVSRSFFQRYSNDDPSLFVMHDLINDLARNVSGEFCFTLEDNASSKIMKKARHFSYVPANDDVAFQKFMGIDRAKCLRTFLPLQNMVWFKSNEISEKVTQDLLPRLRRLRVLSLSCYSSVAQLPSSMDKLKHLRYLDLHKTSVEKLPKAVGSAYNLQTLILKHCEELVELPESIGNLKHLRYVDLCYTRIKRLPASLCGLYNLQTLILQHCVDLIQLPSDLGRLVNLCLLDIEGTKLLEMPSHMGKLTKLQKLTDFFIGEQNGSSIKELGMLQNLKGELKIWNLQNVVDPQDFAKAILKNTKLLEKLELLWDDHRLGDNSQHDRRLLDKLEACTKVKKINIDGYGGTRFPDWVANSSFSNVVSMRLTKCKHCTILPPLGQLGSLKELLIKELRGVRAVGQEFYGSCMSMKMPFGSLQSLTLERMPQWHEWISDEAMEAFPLLQVLHIKDCPNLTKAMPRHHLLSLTELEIKRCHRLLGPFPTCPIIDKIGLEDDSRDLLLLKISGLHRLNISKFDSPYSLVNDLKQMGCLPTTLGEIKMHNLYLLKRFPLETELFPRLKNLEIEKCPNLLSLSVDEGLLDDLTSLNSLKILECPKLVTFPEGGLPAPNLTQLELWDCKNLKSLPERMHSLLPSLVNLLVVDCPKLESFPKGGLPSKLRALRIGGCHELIAGRMQWNLQSLHSLSDFKIGCDEDVESFPEKALLPSSLTSLAIRNLKNLKFLNYKGLQHLSSLRQMIIYGCPNLHHLPEEGLPSSLSSLIIMNCSLLEKRCQREKGEDWLKISHIPSITMI